MEKTVLVVLFTPGVVITCIMDKALNNGDFIQTPLQTPAIMSKCYSSEPVLPRPEKSLEYTLQVHQKHTKTKQSTFLLFSTIGPLQGWQTNHTQKHYLEVSRHQKANRSRVRYLMFKMQHQLISH